MENKPARSMFLKFLPRAASAVVTFQNHPFSPGRDHHHHKHKAHAHKGFSGPINFSALPDEARSRPNHDEKPQEPTSPKVSCMGQIKHKKKKLLKAASRSTTPRTTPKKSSSSAISKLFRRSNNVTADNAAPNLHTNNNNADDNDAMPIPKLGSMRKFASGRESLAHFDWTTARMDHHREYYSDEERGRRDNNDEDEDDDDEDEYNGGGGEREVIIPFSAPMVVGGRGGGLGLEPRKEVNLWKRRTLAPPPPLALKVRS